MVKSNKNNLFWMVIFLSSSVLLQHSQPHKWQKGFKFSHLL